ncbi:DUF2182 domain-containing protein [Halomonas cerina]|uniref:Putative metal-binding membrane protein n=1 Tax=Halomonas cerina TaxID=447424 RepID=A0A839V786_9GAMM|nr:DUF2182 domain-containing protein [Halomonas cerina]MBB3189898.1 putative metal-binding membrane protein [Halomonas cerina]
MALANVRSGWRYERYVALAGLFAMAALAWLYLGVEAHRMEAMLGEMAGSGPMEAPDSAWNAGPLLLTLVMWTVMMVAMMLPSATPAILLYGAMARKSRDRASGLPSVGVFTMGYLAVWTAFSLAATVLHAAFDTWRLLTPAMTSASTLLSGSLLIAAGIYQWLPIKNACLEKCRAPLQFFLFRWRPGARGALQMGAEHGLFCVGCCWALMLLLFTAGVMNLLWVALIAAFVLIEKLAPGGALIARIAGVVLGVVGAALILGSA